VNSEQLLINLVAGSVLDVVDVVHALLNMVQKDVGLIDLFPKLSLHLPCRKNVPSLLLVCVCYVFHPATIECSPTVGFHWTVKIFAPTMCDY
jgi:hypothetical protein